MLTKYAWSLLANMELAIGSKSLIIASLFPCNVCIVDLPLLHAGLVIQL